jgi:hypothetical protein
MAYLELPNGKYIKVPEGMSPDQAYDAAIAKFPDLLAETKQKSGIGAALGKGTESFLGAGQTTLESMFGADEAATRGLRREEETGKKYAEQVGLDKLKEAYAQKGITGAGGELMRQVPLALAEQAPNIAASLGSAKLGAMAGSAFGPIGTAVGGGLGALAPSALQLFGSNVQRQASEQEKAGTPVDINVGSALGATAVQAPLDVAATFIPLGGKVAGKFFGPQVEKLLQRGGTKAAEELAQESFKKTLGKGLATGAAAEIPTEVLQQVAERAQAGLSLTSPEALKEYGETAYQVGLLAPIGGAGRFIDKSAAKAQVEEKAQEDRRVAQDEARKAQEQADMEKEALAKEFYSKPEGQAEIAQRTAEYEQQVDDLRQVLKQKDLTKEDKQTAKQQLEDLGTTHNAYLQQAGVAGQIGETTAPLNLEQRLQALKDQREQAKETERAGLTLGEAVPAASALPNRPELFPTGEVYTTGAPEDIGKPILAARQNAPSTLTLGEKEDQAKELESNRTMLANSIPRMEFMLDNVQKQLDESIQKGDTETYRKLVTDRTKINTALEDAKKQQEALPKSPAEERTALEKQISTNTRMSSKKKGSLKSFL